MSDQVYNSYIQHFNAYEAKALKLLIAEFGRQLKAIKFDNLTFENAKYVIVLNFDEESLKNTLYKVHYTIGKAYGTFIAKQLRKDNPIQLKKWKPLPFFNEEFQRFLIQYYSKYGGALIRTLSETMTASVVSEISKGTYENETVEEMRDRIYKTVNKRDFYLWQAMRIARTETGFAMNSAKDIAGQTSGVLMQKVWIGRNDGRERASHIRANGQKVDQNEMFSVGGIKMKHPGDRENGTAEETINCRCTFGYEAKRDENGRLIFTD
ncbi:phage minor head protein [Chryseobacterium aureum]|uniref:phage minor head protein n=1 Tax=Chryseobacterium aureum TaxID=2497456 RepID=UPI000F892F54|nr:phage minor head protein [Chryseobacterium aureum]